MLPRRAGRIAAVGATVDDVVVHQQDVQSVVNALWAGGAEAMTIMDVRVICTSAVRCVGNTLLLDGKVYSAAVLVTAIGDPGGCSGRWTGRGRPALSCRCYVAFGLGYQNKVETDVTVPAYDGSIALRSAHVPG